MATSKTLTPTNVTIQIPAFTDKPDQRVNSNCIDKEADAINALSDQIANEITMPASASGISEFNLGKNLLDYFSSQSNLMTNHVYGIRNVVTGWDTVVGYAIKYDSSNYKVVVTNSTSMMLNCTKRGSTYTVYQFTGEQKT